MRLIECRHDPTFSPMGISRFLIVLGIVILAAGLLWPVLAKFGLGRLPGDIAIERENFRFYFPLMTSLLLSIVFSVVLWLANR
ncbi:MAG TPA: DUF2905 domain-containing protein [Xanthobacteraceae bacterium]|nr:DUF2905 domain-containing protein [Xanthobacteraceae bacterium]